MFRQIYLISACLLMLSVASFAQNLRGFNYQAILRDPANNFEAQPLQPVTLYFEILEETQNSDPVYREMVVTSTNAIGLVNVIVGNGIVEVGDYEQIDWSAMPKWLKVIVEIDGNEVILGTNQLVNVPYALYAESSGSALEAGEGIMIENDQIINIGDLNEGEDVHEGDPAAGALSGTYPNPGLGQGVVEESNLADNAVTSDKIANGTIQTEDLGQMGAADGNVLKWNGVSWVPATDSQGDISGIIADGEVTGPLTDLTIAPNAVVSENIQDGSIGPEDLRNSGLSDGDILKFNGTNWIYTQDQTGIQNGDAAGGDLTGTYPNPNLGNNVVESNNIIDGSINASDLSQMGASNGQVLKWNQANNTWEPQNDSAGSGGDDWGDQVVETDNESIEGSGVTGDPVRLGRNNANNGQVLKWDGIDNAWKPAEDLIVTYSAGDGINIDNDNEITNTGDQNPNDDLLINDQAGGDVSGTFSNLELNPGVVDNIELADNAVNSAKIQNGTIQPQDLSTQGASNGDVLKFQNGNWTLAEDDIGDAAPNYQAGEGIMIDGAEISNTGDLDEEDDLLKTDEAGGDISGTFDNLQIRPDVVGTTEIIDNSIESDDLADEAVNSDKIKDGSIELIDLGLQGANANDVLKFDGTNWSFSPDEAGSIGDNWGSQLVEHDSSLEGDGTAGNPLGIVKTGAGEGQVLKFISGEWIAANDNGDVYEPGIGIQFDGSFINALNEEEIWNAAQILGKPIGGMGPAEGDVFYYNGTEWIYGPMGGEVQGTYDSLEVKALKGKPIGGMGPADGDVFYYDGSSGDEGEWRYGSLDGEVQGTYDDLEVKALKGKPIGGMGPADGDVFYYDGGSGDEGEWRYGTLQGEVGGTYDALELQIPIDKADNLGSSMIRMENSEGAGIEGVGTNSDNDEITPGSIANASDPDDLSDDYGIGVLGVGAPGGNNDGIGVWGKAMDNSNLYGYGGIFQGRFAGIGAFTYGDNDNCLNSNAGLWAYGNDCTHSAIRGTANGARYGGYFQGLDSDFYQSGTLTAGVYANQNGADWAGYFDGDVNISDDLFVADDLTVNGTINNFGFTSGFKAFKIDHPLDPQNKFLMHSCVESPDMKNIYDGVVVTDESGFATVELPEYFEALNKDFRYQLTVIGQFAQAIIAEKVHDNRFVIQTDKPNVEVSWQITGIRHDPFAEQNRIEVEVEKTDEESGKYLFPEAYNQSEENGIHYQKSRLNTDQLRLDTRDE